MEIPAIGTQQRWVCRALGTLAGSLDYWVAETRRREADLAGLRGVPYQWAAMAFQEAVRAQQRAITDLRDGAAHAAVVAGWLPVVGEDDGDGA